MTSNQKERQSMLKLTKSMSNFLDNMSTGYGEYIDDARKFSMIQKLLKYAYVTGYRDGYAYKIEKIQGE